MDYKNTASNLFIELQQLEKQLESLEKDHAQAEADRNSRPAAAKTEPPGTGHGKGTHAEESCLGEIRGLLLRIKEDSAANVCQGVLKEQEWKGMKQELANARNYITVLQAKLNEKEEAPLPGGNTNGDNLAEGARTDLKLTAESDRAHALLEGERREFREHYNALEKDFETNEKELIDEIRALKERETKRTLEHEKLNMELDIAREKMQAAESKASSLAIEMMELNVYNKSAAAALREKDLEISDLKQALERLRNAGK